MIADLPSPRLAAAVEAALAKSAGNVVVLDLREMGAFTGHFLVCTGWSTPQIQAIADEIDRRMMDEGLRRAHREGYDKAEWVLLDYG
ncbi:MAG TPA: ribosome silencing factor, partial [Candidatus Dormibacteraeota bacterium]|nr:ribosome silencing factor [Candidatus Dormibacteraeota bacterium]